MCVLLIIISDLDRQAGYLVVQGLRPNTNRIYSSAQKSYIYFCEQYKLVVLPANEQTLLWFIAHVHSKGVKSNSMQVYLSAVRSLHLLNGMEPPPICSPSIKLALKAEYELGTHTTLVHMVDLLQCDPNNLVWSAILTQAFFGALHGAEYNLVVDSHGTMIAPLPLVSNISFGTTSHGIHFMTYWVSKTHPHGFLYVIGCSRTRVCAVCAMTLYLSNTNATRQLTSCAPLFILHNGQAINKTLVNTKI